MSETIPPQDTRPSRADADDVADAVIGVDTRIFRTVWDTLVHTPRVLQAAFEGDRERYVPILRLFLILFGLQFAVVAFIGLPQSMSLDQFVRPGDTDVLNNWLGGQTADAVNLTLERAAGLTNTILVFLSSLPYLLLLKLYRPSRSFFGHALAYLLATNVSYLVMLPLMLPAALGNFIFWYVLSFSVGLSVFYVAAGRILYSHYSQKAWVVALQVLGMLLLLPITLLLVILGQLGTAELVMRVFHDLSYFELFFQLAEAQAQ
ncbi:hypothetical protein [Hyphobacterium marinum]|uniref:Yip1 domain-containing protein n=1 Tax=Hyphobacterium marinum TaxID=3116574 RepID=A0ABU7M0H6_9PROT|nr:hypothetical protein [Hyphobacterium sp. Y6023]MEE2567275.1 hypothetical protein [Hyphobacterium sp. Y6023]